MFFGILVCFHLSLIHYRIYYHKLTTEDLSVRYGILIIIIILIIFINRSIIIVFSPYKFRFERGAFL